MKGSIFKSTSRAGKTTWRYQIVAGRDESGKPVRLGKSGFRLEREAAEAMRDALRELRRGPVNTASTFAAFMEEWLPYHAKAKPLAPKTAERYESLMAHATKALGHVALKDLTPFLFDDLYVKLAETLSAKSVREVHNVVHVALKRAVKTKLIPFNPADNCDLPRVDQREAVALGQAQLAAYQAEASGTWVDLIVRLGAAVGARRGELLACTWAGLDFAAAKLRIERAVYQVKGEIGLKPTKNRTVRTVSIPASLIEYLKLHREQQDKNREMFGPDYRTDLDLIFADPAGNFLKPSSVTRAAVRIAKQAGLSGVGLHTLRHSHASGLLAAGVPVTNVSKRLGHRDAYTTAKIYAHALPDSDQDVAATWDKLSTAEPERSAQLCTNEAPQNHVKN